METKTKKKERVILSNKVIAGLASGKFYVPSVPNQKSMKT